MGATTKITKWGNSCGVRIPATLLKEAKMRLDESVYIDANKQGDIVIRHTPLPKPDTIEYLFNGYNGDSFKTELIDFGESKGNEKW
jgi:antitoxin MazE